MFIYFEGVISIQVGFTWFIKTPCIKVLLRFASSHQQRKVIASDNFEGFAANDKKGVAQIMI